MTYAAGLQALLDLEPEPDGGTRGGEVDYVADDGTRCSGYLATPSGQASVPAVLVLHDGAGVGDYVRMRCDMLARLGYLAFAGDVFGAGIRPSMDNGLEEMMSVVSPFYDDLPLLRRRVRAGFHRMVEEERVDRARTAAIGYCFGGAGALQLARTGAPLAGVVSFHGGLQVGPKGEAERIRARLLVLTGASDPVVPDADILALKDELRHAPDLDWQVVAYAGAMHAFTMPGTDAPELGARYQPRAERRSWVAMKSFLGELFAP